MIWVPLFIFFVVSFTQLLRVGQKVRGDLPAITAINYIVAAVTLLATLPWLGAWPLPRIPDLVLACGVLNGLVYVLHLVAIQASYRFAGVGITAAFLGSSAILPVLVSWGIWQESMTPARWLALALLPVGVYLLRPRDPSGKKLGWRADVILALAFLGAGLIGIVHKTSNIYAPALPTHLYLCVVFLVASASSAGYTLWLGRALTRRQLRVGGLFGLCNAAANICMLRGIATVEGTVFFPLTSAGLILGNVLVSWFLWGERPVRRQRAGILIAVLIVVLTNL